ncbi:MAG: phosphoadenosine phosphosulfate reductase family protein [Nitrososphaerota archaeon]|jgi:phosphoadenosine phosphosulfate reductase|nr:phosphoadenosine phosphosulfate reductase family protein [Nitrososphaerota archaeon]MDG6932387.1 phosphoadenosine phosphosulfate reductase family protein [Nitrososphaerota archaeon]MDG6935730.1 phosphoadenosine phosphosulfate reductase family protein [Nitrososphaerota archaeon]MDG6944716.1 phosphoadenosine phosphosulfate reductase family protein [Nitrososphaerota archaeon]
MQETRIEGGLSLNAKVAISKIVVKDALERFRRPFVVWSAGKDSMVVLHIVKAVVEEMGTNMPPALFIDHGQHYDETYRMIEEISKQWNFRVISAKNEDAISKARDGKVYVKELSEENKREARRIGFTGEYFEYSLETDVGNHIFKTVAMNDTIRKYRIDALFTGIRWDENPARSREVFISPREEPAHVRVHPILPFTERNIWDYTFKNNLPIHPLYKEGYRSIDGKYDSKKVGDKPAWEQDLEHTRERAGRSQDKEGMMERLREFGYM